MVNMGELFAHPRIPPEVSMDRVELSSKELDKSSLAEHDLLFGRRSLVREGAGRCSLVLAIEEPTTFESSLIRARIDGTKADPHFYYYLFMSAPGRSLIWSIVEQVSVSGIRLSDLARLQVPCPSLADQEAVTATLRPYDDRIQTICEIAKTVEAMARSLYRAWFVDYEPMRDELRHCWPDEIRRHFPLDFSEDGAPSGWTRGSLGDIAERVVERVRTPSDWAGEALIDLGRIPQHTLALRDWGSGSELATSVTRFQRGDVLFGSIRPYLHKVGVAPLGGVTNTSVFVIRAKSDVLWPFVVLSCSEDSTVGYATRMSQGLKMPSIRWPDLEAMEVVIPPEELLARFHGIVAVWIESILDGAMESVATGDARDEISSRLFQGVFHGSSEVSA